MPPPRVEGPPALEVVTAEPVFVHRMSELMERETVEYLKSDPDPFDDRHPGSHYLHLRFTLPLTPDPNNPDPNNPNPDPRPDPSALCAVRVSVCL